MVDGYWGAGHSENWYELGWGQKTCQRELYLNSHLSDGKEERKDLWKVFFKQREEEKYNYLISINLQQLKSGFLSNDCSLIEVEHWNHKLKTFIYLTNKEISLNIWHIFFMTQALDL